MPICYFICVYLFPLILVGQAKKDSLLLVTKTTTSQNDKAYAHSRLAWLYILSDIKIAEAHLDSAYTIYTSLKDKKSLAYVNYKYGVLNRVAGKYALAHSYIDDYKTYLVSVKDSLGIADAYYQKGVLFSLQGDYEKSLEAYYENLKLYEAQGDLSGESFTMNSIAIVYKNLENYDKAIEFLNKAAAIQIKVDDEENLSDTYSTLANIFASQNKIEKAMDYYNKVIALSNDDENNWGLAIAYLNIAKLYISQNRNTQALTYLGMAEEIQKANNYKNELAQTYINSGQAYMNLGNYKVSESYLNKALGLKLSSKKINSELQIRLKELNEITKNYKAAIKHLELFNKYQDSIFEEESLKNINRLQFKYETEKKNAEINTQKLVIAEKDNSITKQRIKTNSALGAAILFLILGVASWLVFKQRQKRKNQEIIALRNEAQVNTLESLIEGEEKERLRIAKELHDGVNGDLSAIKHKLNTLLEMNNKTIAEAVDMIDKSCEQVRAISHNLVPPALDNFNLQTAAQDYCTNMNAIHNPNIRFDFIGPNLNLSKIIEVNIFRIIQELLTNSLKHADANEIHVQLSNQDDNLQLSVDDDGIGFNLDDAKDNGLGFSNIKNRVAFLNGEVDFTSSPNGTSVNIFMDITKFKYD